MGREQLQMLLMQKFPHYVECNMLSYQKAEEITFHAFAAAHLVYINIFRSLDYTVMFTHIPNEHVIVIM